LRALLHLPSTSLLSARVILRRSPRCGKDGQDLFRLVQQRFREGRLSELRSEHNLKPPN